MSSMQGCATAKVRQFEITAIALLCRSACCTCSLHIMHSDVAMRALLLRPSPVQSHAMRLTHSLSLSTE